MRYELERKDGSLLVIFRSLHFIFGEKGAVKNFNQGRAVSNVHLLIHFMTQKII